jgi:hypothetical protein
MPVTVHISDGAFKLNLFRVDQLSTPDAAAERQSLSKEPGFERFTKEETVGGLWHFEYTLAGGKAGAALRLDVNGTKIDCTTHGQPADTVILVVTSCRSLKPQ